MKDLYAVIGNPIGHTKSPMIHQAFAEQTGQDLEYVAIAGTIGGFAADADAFRARGGRGMNVTVPFKLDAFAYADAISEAAAQAGALNCLAFEDGRVVGHNFDGTGLVNDIQVNLGCPVKGKRVLLLGAGGAVRGALLPLLEQNPAELIVVNRNGEKAAALASKFPKYQNLAGGGYEMVGGHDPRGFDIVLNATSASLAALLPPIPPAVFGPKCLAYELLYGKGLTPFLRFAKAAGVTHLADGVGMLVEQAAEAFLLWRGVRPRTAPVIASMTVPLE